MSSSDKNDELKSEFQEIKNSFKSFLEKEGWTNTIDFSFPYYNMENIIISTNEYQNAYCFGLAHFAFDQNEYSQSSPFWLDDIFDSFNRIKIRNKEIEYYPPVRNFVLVLISKKREEITLTKRIKNRISKEESDYNSKDLQSFQSYCNKNFSDVGFWHYYPGVLRKYHEPAYQQHNDTIAISKKLSGIDSSLGGIDKSLDNIDNSLSTMNETPIEKFMNLFLEGVINIVATIFMLGISGLLLFLKEKFSNFNNFYYYLIFFIISLVIIYSVTKISFRQKNKKRKDS